MSINFVFLFFDGVFLIAAYALLVLCLVLLVECSLALLPITEQLSGNSQNAKVAVLVPAHNEELVIRSTLLDIKSQLEDQHRLIVIADNCSDRTAEIARAMGAEVLTRENSHQRGKGYALDYGLRFLESDPPDVVVFIDADCRVQISAIASITHKAIALNRPVQAIYLMAKPTNSTPKESVSIFAFKVKNLVRPLGLAKFKLPCLLTGTGMAFPWSVISSVDLANGYIVEDMKLGLDLTIAGYAPVLCSIANITGNFPQQMPAVNTQRTRWEHGHLQTLLTYVPLLFQAAIHQQRLDLLMTALDMCVPPLSLLVLIWLGLFASSLLLAFFTAFWIPAILLTTAGLFLLTAIFTSWAKFGIKDLPLWELLTIPFYILWKIPLYFKFLVQPQSIWVRTERDSINVSEP